MFHQGPKFRVADPTFSVPLLWCHTEEDVTFVQYLSGALAMARSLPEDGQQTAPGLKVDGGLFLNVLQAHNGFQSLKQL